MVISKCKTDGTGDEKDYNRNQTDGYRPSSWSQLRRIEFPKLKMFEDNARAAIIRYWFGSSVLPNE